MLGQVLGYRSGVQLTAGDAEFPGQLVCGLEHVIGGRQRIDELMRAHYDRWVSEPVPALGGLSPLEAVQRPAGREKVKALVDQIERNGPRMQPPLDPDIVDELRGRLGLG